MNNFIKILVFLKVGKNKRIYLKLFYFIKSTINSLKTIISNKQSPQFVIYHGCCTLLFKNLEFRFKI